MKRGDIYYADLRPVIGSEQGGIRPAITSRMNKANLPTHIELQAGRYDMMKDSVILLEQLRTIDKQRLKDKVCHLDEDIMKKVNRGLMISLELTT